MTRSEALSRLDLPDDAEAAEIDRAYEALCDDLQRRIQNASTPAFKERLEKQVRELDAAYAFLRRESAAPSARAPRPAAARSSSPTVTQQPVVRAYALSPVLRGCLAAVSIVLSVGIAYQLWLLDPDTVVDASLQVLPYVVEIGALLAVGACAGWGRFIPRSIAFGGSGAFAVLAYALFAVGNEGGSLVAAVCAVLCVFPRSGTWGTVQTGLLFIPALVLAALTFDQMALTYIGSELRHGSWMSVTDPNALFTWLGWVLLLVLNIGALSAGRAATASRSANAPRQAHTIPASTTRNAHDEEGPSPSSWSSQTLSFDEAPPPSLDQIRRQVAARTEDVSVDVDAAKSRLVVKRSALVSATIVMDPAEQTVTLSPRFGGAWLPLFVMCFIPVLIPIPIIAFFATASNRSALLGQLQACVFAASAS